MRDIENLLDFWEAHAQEELVLATIVCKYASGYRSVGAKKIIARTESCGLLSGGCLEADIDHTARQHWDDLPLLRTFSTTQDADRLFGYQAGCAGTIDVLFERLPLEMRARHTYIPFGENPQAAGVLIGLTADTLGHRCVLQDEPADGQFSEREWFYDAWVEPITLCIVGCGPDAPALHELARLMGWQVLLLDYRPDYVATGPQTRICPLSEISRRIPSGARVAVVLMTHNYAADLRILQGLAHNTLGYLGCLGPRKRFEQLKADLWTEYALQFPEELEAVIHAPAGLLARGHCPEEIALSVTAEIQSILRHRPARQACLTHA